MVSASVPQCLVGHTFKSMATLMVPSSIPVLIHARVFMFRIYQHHLKYVIIMYLSSSESISHWSCAPQQSGILAKYEDTEFLADPVYLKNLWSMHLGSMARLSGCVLEYSSMW